MTAPGPGATIPPMRTLLVTLALAAAVLPRAPAADAPQLIELEVGERRPLPGFRPLCDDPGIASLSDGTIEGRKPGETTCSLSTGSPLGPRQVYRVVVRPPAKGGGGGGSGPRGSEG